MSLYHLGSLMTFAYIAFLIATVLVSKYIIISLIEDIFRDAKGWKRDIGLFFASTIWLLWIAGMALNVYKYLFNFST